MGEAKDEYNRFSHSYSNFRNAIDNTYKNNSFGIIGAQTEELQAKGYDLAQYGLAGPEGQRLIKVINTVVLSVESDSLEVIEDDVGDQRNVEGAWKIFKDLDADIERLHKENGGKRLTPEQVNILATKANKEFFEHLDSIKDKTKEHGTVITASANNLLKWPEDHSHEFIEKWKTKGVDVPKEKAEKYMRTGYESLFLTTFKYAIIQTDATQHHSKETETPQVATADLAKAQELLKSTQGALADPANTTVAPSTGPKETAQGK